MDHAQLDKLAALADPAKNPNAHEREAAAAKLNQLKQKSAPGLEAYDRAQAIHTANVRMAMDEMRVEAIWQRAREAMRASDSVSPKPKPAASANVSDAPKAKASDSVSPQTKASANVSDGPKPTASVNVSSQATASDSVSSKATASDSVSPEPEPTASDSVSGRDKARAVSNAARAARRAEERAGRSCLTCGKPLTAQRGTARYCGPACRFQAWRGRQRGQ